MVDTPSPPTTGGADLVTATGQFSWPSAVRYLAVSGQFLMAADNRLSRRKPHLTWQRGDGLLCMDPPTSGT
jgi:hypothetical protein